MPFDALDWRECTSIIIGLTLNIVGIVFLANGITFKKPKRVLHEYFGVEKALPLKKIRDYVLNKTQVYIGFTFLIVGYAIQIWATLSKHKAEIAAKSKAAETVGINLLFVFMILVASIIMLTVILKIVQFAWTRFNFKHIMIEFFREHDWELVKNVEVAKQIGELLKIPKHKDDSIEDYILRVKRALSIPLDSEAAASGRSERAESLRAQKPIVADEVHPATPPRIG